MREARAVVRDLVEDSARLAEVDRVEEVAIDDRGAGDAGLLESLVPQRMLGNSRAPRDVMNRACALARTRVRHRIEGDRAAAPGAAELELPSLPRSRSPHVLQE